MKKIIPVIIAVAIVAAGVMYIPKLVHTCDDCESFFVGAGYEANVIEDLFSKDEQVICKECAQSQHALSIKMGKSIEDFKRDLFE